MGGFFNFLDTFDEENPMVSKMLLAMDDNSDYTFEDFSKEFGDSMGMNASMPFSLNRINFVNKSNNENPDYQTEGSAGFDLRAHLDESVIIEPHKTAIVPTGLYFELPLNYEMQIRPRSGLAAKNGVTVLNSPGTIDSDYRGEIKVILINHSDTPFTIANGDRIAQAVIATVLGKNIINLTQVQSISEDTDRGTGGFGSTGTK